MAIQYPQRYDDDFLNTIKTLIDHVNVHGKSIQDLVAEGQLTEEQYAELLTTINSLVKSGHVDKNDLTPEFKDEIEGFSARLAETLKPGEVSVLDIDKNKGKFDQTYMTEEFLQQMAGTTPINAIPADGSLTSSKYANQSIKLQHLAYTTDSKNHFDKETSTLGKLISHTDGTTSNSSTYDTSDFINLESDTYTFTKVRRIVLFDDSDNFVAGYDVSPSTYPDQVRTLEISEPKVKISYSKTDADTVQVEQGSESSSYEPYGKVIVGSSIANETIGKSKLTDKSIDMSKLDFAAVNHVYTRYGEAHIDFEMNKVSFTTTNTTVVVEFIDGTRMSKSNGEGEFIINDGDVLTYDLIANTITVKNNDNTHDFDVILALYDSNKLLGGYLIEQNKVQEREILIPDYYEFVDFTSHPNFQSISHVADELWIFKQSVDDHSNNNGLIIRLNKDDYSYIGEITHNLGHCNSVSYNERNDCLLIGNGTESYTDYAKFWLFDNVTSWKSLSDININTISKIEYDMSSTQESKCQACWGDSHFGDENIIYVVTNDNKKIRKCFLTKGTNYLSGGFGTFIEGKTAEEYNGKLKVLETYSVGNGLGKNNGTAYHGGKLYTAVYVPTRVVIVENSFTANKTIKQRRIELQPYDNYGNKLKIWPQGLDIRNGKIYSSFIDDLKGMAVFDIPK